MDAASSTPTSLARSSLRLRLQATTSMPKASPICATRPPIFPSPSSPSRRPCRSAPTVLCQGPPSRRALLSSTMPRASPSSRAHVSSTGGAEELAVPHTVTPCACAAAWSMTVFRIPEATRSRSRGSRAKSDPGNGTRSRSVTTMSNSASASASASSSAKCSAKDTTSTRSASADQSATVVATCWKSSSTAQRNRMPAPFRSTGGAYRTAPRGHHEPGRADESPPSGRTVDGPSASQPAVAFEAAVDDEAAAAMTQRARG